MSDLLPSLFDAAEPFNGETLPSSHNSKVGKILSCLLSSFPYLTYLFSNLTLRHLYLSDALYPPNTCPITWFPQCMTHLHCSLLSVQQEEGLETMEEFFQGRQELDGWKAR